MKYILMTFLFVIILAGCTNEGLKEANFVNVKPSISIDGKEYIITKDTVDSNSIEKEFAKITKINEIVSYPDESNPYKNLGKVYTIKGKNSNEEIALEINNKLFLSKIVLEYTENK